jgi:hypothetical protein
MFINCLLGREYLPSDETPETVGVVLVQGSSDLEHVDGCLYVFDPNSTNGGAGRLLAQGQARINAKLREINCLQRVAAKAASEAWTAWSPGQDAYTVHLPEEDVYLPITVPQLVLKVPFPTALTGQAAIGSFDLYDTPGANEAHRGIKALVESNARRILQNADVVIVLIDFTQMGTDQEQQLFECVAVHFFVPDSQSSSLLHPRLIQCPPRVCQSRLIAEEKGRDYPGVIIVVNKTDAHTSRTTAVSLVARAFRLLTKERSHKHHPSFFRPRNTPTGRCGHINSK